MSDGRSDPTRRRFLRSSLRVGVACASAGLLGCERFPRIDDWGHLDPVPGERGLDAVNLQVPVARDTVQVEVVFVERPLDDPLMGDQLWRDLEQVGAVDQNIRSKLERHGIRVGHCGATPPRALQKLLGMQAQIVETGTRALPKNVHGQRIGLPTGDDYEIQASPVYQDCEIRLDPADETAVRAFRNTRCVLRLAAEPTQDGWVRLDFQPEIHHGAHRLRRTMGEGRFELRQSQDVVPVYALRFPMELSTREYAVIGHLPTSTPRSLGRHFFVGNHDDAQLQRLLVVRVADVGRGSLVSVE